VRAIVGSLANRNGQLRPYFASGAIGLTADGHVEVRDQNAVPLPDRAKVKSLVADEIRDREYPEHLRETLDREGGSRHLVSGRRQLEAEVSETRGRRERASSFHSRTIRERPYRD
jgi:hypothetical protein